MNSTNTNRQFRHYDQIMALFVAVLLISNIASSKILDLWRFTFDGGTILFPLSYIFGDVLTQVYGYRRSRRVIWAGFGGLAFASLMAWVVVALPPAPFWQNQAAYEIAFGSAPRIALASLVAFLCGEFVNSYVLAKMKIWTDGRWLWTRTIGSTIFGEGVDSLLFYPLAFYGGGLMPDERLPGIMLAQFLGKVGVEILFTPVTYRVVAALKRAEHEDYYDRNTDFNPFTLKT